MKSNHRPIEDRLSDLEREVQRLKDELAACQKTGWRAVIGSHADDPTYNAFLRELRRNRRKDYAQAAGRTGKRKRVTAASGK